MFFTNEAVVDFETAKRSDTERYAVYFRGMLDRGVFLAPSQFEAMFISAAHSDDDILATMEAAGEALALVR
jgi:glutamate-1-semialdehyde 2,1-aminomutase